MQAGDRLMDIRAQGQDILVNFDVFQEAGKSVPALSSHTFSSSSTEATGMDEQWLDGRHVVSPRIVRIQAEHIQLSESTSHSPLIRQEWS